MSNGAYLRFPHLQGDLLTFVAEDDIWLAPVTGGQAWRLTTDRTPVSSPRLSPDGALVAWTATRDGGPEVYVAATDGSAVARRLTYWGAHFATVIGWTDAGEVIVSSDRGSHSAARRFGYAVNAETGADRRLPYGWVGSIAFAGDAVLIGTPPYRDPAHWKRYRGGTAVRLWLDRRGDGQFTRLLPTIEASLTSPMILGDRLALVSDHEGVGSLYSAPLSEELSVDALTRHTNTEFYVRNATTDGPRIVYQCFGELWLVDGLDAEPARIDVQPGSSRSGRAKHAVTAAETLGDFAPDRTGRASAVEVRGSLHWLTHRDGPVPSLGAGSSVRRRLPTIVGEQMAFVSDADGEDAIEVRSDDGAESRRIGSGELGRVLELAASPDGAWLAAASHDGRLLLVDTASGALREVVRSTEAEVTGLAFSPDSAWLAWAHPGPEPLRHIRMAPVAGGDIVDVTPLRFADFDPTFTADGKHLAFLSVRSFDPVYDAYVFDLSFPNGCRPHLVPLAADTPSPFDPSREGRGFETKDDGEKPDAPPAVQVDVEGIQARAVGFPVPAARYSRLRAVTGGVTWLRDPLVGMLGDDLAASDDRPRSALERFDLAKRSCEVLVEAVDRYEVSGDGSRLVLLDEHELRVLPADRKVSPEEAEKSDDVVTVDLTRARTEVDPDAEWRQAYDEAGRLMRDNYWRPDLRGIDWLDVLNRYRPLLDRIGSHDDLVDVLWEVQGELGTSHAYVRARGDDKAEKQGLLGADLSVDGAGGWRIDRVLPSEPSDRRARSPLTAPGVGARVGDVIVSVNGRDVDPAVGPGPLLVGAAGKPVELTLRSDGTQRRVAVVPVDDEGPLRYQAWVADRRAYVHAQSDGRLGYLHVPDMMSLGWAQLHRDLRLELARAGVVVDLRDNGGGHISELVVEKLARKVIGWSQGRGYSPRSYPVDAPRGPIVTLCDEWTGSDGDIATAAIKLLELGPVVGVRTWGGVVGIDGKYSLVDGTMVTQPRYAFWFNQFGWGVENYGVEPDVEVQTAPHDVVAGADPQLDKGIELALEALDAHGTVSPPELPTD